LSAATIPRIIVTMRPAERDAVEREVRRIVDASPFEIFEIRIGQDRSVHLLLDRKEGRLSVDDAARFNHQLRNELAAVPIDVDKWSIVIESPGAFRPLRTPRHYERCVGERIRVVRRGTLDTQVVIGTLRSATASEIVVAPDGAAAPLTIRFDEIANARLDPRLPF
jgi:ribosome maturation factor RimP